MHGSGCVEFGLGAVAGARGHSRRRVSTRLRTRRLLRARHALLQIVLIGMAWLLAAGAVGSAAHAAHAADCAVGVVLAGGGARGGAHIGALRELERARVPVNCIAGTSVGAIIAALYATGASPDEIEAFAASIDWDQVFSDRSTRRDTSFRRKLDDELALVHPGVGFSGGVFKLRGGVITGHNISSVLSRIAARFPGERDFDRLPIPLRIVATDIGSGEAVVFSHGDLAQVLRASMAVPGVFAPVDIDGRLLVDGGVANNLPVDVVRGMGARTVIAVDVSEPLLPQDQIRSAVDVTEQLTNILTRRNTAVQLKSLGERDVLITPELSEFSNTDFSSMLAMVPRGAEAALAVREQLARLQLPTADYAALRQVQRPQLPAPRAIAFYRLHNHSHVTNTVLRRQMRLDELIGQPLTPELLQRHLALAYGTAMFESLRYEPTANTQTSAAPGVDIQGVDIYVDERAWGPDYLNLRLLAEGDLGGAAGVSVGIDYQRDNYSRNGGEWRSYLQLGEQRLIYTELYQPLGRRDGWFVQPRLLYSNRTQGLFSKRGDQLADVDLAETYAELRAGYEFGSNARLEAGVRAGQLETHARIGTILPRADDRNIGEWFGGFTYDDLDDRFFPSTGMRISLQEVSGRGLFGADDHFDQVEADALAALHVGSWRLVGRATYQRTLRGIAPLHRRPRLGGVLRLSGVSSNELTGQQAMLLGATAYRALNTPVLQTYAGIAVGYGDVFEDERFDLGQLRLSASIWAGADLPVGALYFGYGATEGDGDIFFISIGRPL